MQMFKVARWEHLPRQGAASQSYGFQAPGPIVLIVKEGSAWVLREDGTRTTVTGRSVVIYSAGDRVEYGGDGDQEIETYWATDLSEEEWKVRLAAVFGPEAHR